MSEDVAHAQAQQLMVRYAAHLVMWVAFLLVIKIYRLVREGWFPHWM